MKTNNEQSPEPGCELLTECYDILDKMGAKPGPVLIADNNKWDKFESPTKPELETT
jgi:hypothetical protein